MLWSCRERDIAHILQVAEHAIIPLQMIESEP